MNALARVSAVLCVAVCILWGLSYVRAMHAARYDRNSIRLRLVEVSRGGLYASAFTNHYAYIGTGIWNAEPRSSDRLHWSVTGVRVLGFAYGRSGDTVAYRVPLWCLAVSLAVLPLVRVRQLLRRSTPGEPVCPTCGYDVRASPERCPECGTSVISAVPLPHNPPMHRTGPAV